MLHNLRFVFQRLRYRRLDDNLRGSLGHLVARIGVNMSPFVHILARAADRFFGALVLRVSGGVGLGLRVL